MSQWNRKYSNCLWIVVAELCCVYLGTLELHSLKGNAYLITKYELHKWVNKINVYRTIPSIHSKLQLMLAIIITSILWIQNLNCQFTWYLPPNRNQCTHMHANESLCLFLWHLTESFPFAFISNQLSVQLICHQISLQNHV